MGLTLLCLPIQHFRNSKFNIGYGTVSVMAHNKEISFLKKNCIKLNYYFVFPIFIFVHFDAAADGFYRISSGL